jgi:hypothetical protein
MVLERPVTYDDLDFIRMGSEKWGEGAALKPLARRALEVSEYEDLHWRSFLPEATTVGGKGLPIGHRLRRRILGCRRLPRKDLAIEHQPKHADRAAE